MVSITQTLQGGADFANYGPNLANYESTAHLVCSLWRIHAGTAAQVGLMLTPPHFKLWDGRCVMPAVMLFSSP